MTGDIGLENQQFLNSLTSTSSTAIKAGYKSKIENGLRLSAKPGIAQVDLMDVYGALGFGFEGNLNLHASINKDKKFTTNNLEGEGKLYLDLRGGIQCELGAFGVNIIDLETEKKVRIWEKGLKGELALDNQVNSSSSTEIGQNTEKNKDSQENTAANLNPEAESNEFPGFTNFQVESARTWLYSLKYVPKEISVSKEQPVGTNIDYVNGYGVSYKKPTRGMMGDSMADGNFIYSSNGDGTVTYYSTPGHWHFSEEQATDKNWVKNYTQEILDTAKTVELPKGNPEQVQAALNVLYIEPESWSFEQSEELSEYMVSFGSRMNQEYDSIYRKSIDGTDGSLVNQYGVMDFAYYANDEVETPEIKTISWSDHTLAEFEVLAAYDAGPKQMPPIRYYFVLHNDEPLVLVNQQLDAGYQGKYRTFKPTVNEEIQAAFIEIYNKKN